MVSDKTLNILAKAVAVVDAGRDALFETIAMSDQEFVENRTNITDFINQLIDQFWLANIALAMMGGLTADEIKLLVDEIRKGGQT